ncbi:MAG: hypothetical protein ACK4QL_02985 [Pseudanabaenaceae cyanobacterium]
MPVSLQHEIIVVLLNTLLMNYCVHTGIPFVAPGAYTQTIPTKADLSFCFGELKEVSDLCIEVVISSVSNGASQCIAT